MIKAGNTRRGPLALRVSAGGLYGPADAVFFADFAAGQYRWNGANKSLSDFSYTRSTTGTFLGSNGLLQTAAINVPRIEYDSSGNVVGYLSESSSTNRLLQSEDLGTTWVATNASVATNVATAPDGLVTADRITGDATVAAHSLQSNSMAFTSGAPSAFSIFVKKDNYRYVQLAFPSASHGVNAFANYDLDTGTTYAVGSSATARILALPNGWYRISCVATASASASGSSLVAFSNAGGTRLPAFDASGLNILAWGGQSEVGSIMTSYIPTASSGVTRAADSMFAGGLTGLPLTAGTMFVEGGRLVGTTSGFSALLSVNSGSTSGELYQTNLWTNQGMCFGMGDIFPSGWTMGEQRRMAYAFSNGTNSRCSLNGVGTGGPVGGTLNTGLNRVDIGARGGGASQTDGHIKRIIVFPTRYSNAALDGLTA